MQRIYLDHNASTPLRKEAKDAMLAVIDEFGNPSSIHLEGRKAKGIVERARAQVAQALGASNAKIIFTSSATEACALAFKEKKLLGSKVEHDAVLAWISTTLKTNMDGRVTVENPTQSALQLANSETGIIQNLPKNLAASDLTQAFGKIPLAFSWLGIGLGVISGHKIGGPKGIGALIINGDLDVEPLIIGGGQEKGIRAGTENVIAIAGFGAAAEASSKDLNAGLWDEVSGIRDTLEDFIETETDDTVIIGKKVDRLPNTSCFSVPGWKSEVQVMQMDLAGFSISAGSACSSGKVRKSKVLEAMGYTEEVNKSAVRVSLGLQTNIEDIEKFFHSWNSSKKFYQARAT